MAAMTGTISESLQAIRIILQRCGKELGLDIVQEQERDPSLTGTMF